MAFSPAPRMLAVGLAVLSALHGWCAEPSAEPLWPGQAPGETQSLPPEKDFFSRPADPLIAGRPIIRLGNVSTPTLTIYRPPAALDTGAAVVVCPGGGYHILALDLEGTEVCTWLNSLGVTGIVLKYRVPRREDTARPFPPLQDVQRALRLIRSRASDLGLDPQRIGVLGFSAGAHLSALAGAAPDELNYPRVDAADDVSARPNFALLIYPGGFLNPRDSTALSAEIAPQPGVTPPTFITMAQDDPVRVENALVYYAALSRAKIPAALHLYPTGGHGYGLRRTQEEATTWPDRAAEWLRAGGWLPPRPPASVSRP